VLQGCPAEVRFSAALLDAARSKMRPPKTQERVS
jgi:hypothetical protein